MPDRGTLMTGPALQHSAGSGAVLVRGPALRDVLYLVAAGARTCRRDGLAPKRFDDLLKTLEAAAAEVPMTPSGHGAGHETDRPVKLLIMDEIGTTETARILGVSARQARRIAGALGARRGPGGVLVLPRGSVEAHRLERIGGR